MKLLTAAQSRQIDESTISEHGVPGVTLMRRAARHVADSVLEFLPPDANACVAFICGTGNNGGDGVGAAADLLRENVNVRVFCVGNEKKATADFNEMVRRLQEYGGSIEPFSNEAIAVIGRSAVIVDALFGTGLTRDLAGAALDAVNAINASDAVVISADIPSGVDADTGEICGVAVQADVTLTFTAAKPGHYITPGAVLAGEVRVCDIGIPQVLINDCNSSVFAVAPDDVSLPKREPETHKGDYGRVLIIAGSTGYTGAPILAAHAATRMGAGLVSVGVPRGIYAIAAMKTTGEMAFPLEGDDTISRSAIEEIADRAARSDAVLIGPGLRTTAAVREIVLSALAQSGAPLILDADGINALAGNIDVLNNAARAVILTPHDGEFARLAGEIPPGKRLETVRNFAKTHGCIVILKGYRTITALPDGMAYINTTGNPGMAKGGSGDVLAGMLAATIAQGFALRDACIAAVYLHGMAGDIAAARLGEYSLTPEDIVAGIPEAIAAVSNQS